MAKPDKKGQLVRFHTPLPDENPDQKYIVTEIHLDLEKPRADIKPVETGLKLPPINTVSVDELEVVKNQ